MNWYEIPLTADQQAMTVPIAGKNYRFRFTWNPLYWVIDISDDSGNLIIGGIPMVTGANLLEQFDYLSLGFGLTCGTDNSPDLPPTQTNLGTTGHLYAFV